MPDSLYIINSAGEKEPFSTEKIYKAARRTGSSPVLAKKIADLIRLEAWPGIKSAEIAKKVRRLLVKDSPGSAFRFSLKEGMRKLGPTGFPFEKFMGEVFGRMGFRVELNQFLPGRCVRCHEIDFVAEKGKLIYLGECKFRHFPGEKVGTKDALANYARFLDILNGPLFRTKKSQNFVIKTIMATNAKFTQQAANYANCVGIELLGWRHPKNNGLEQLIERQRLYPVTVLPSYRGYLIDILSAEKIMIVEDILKIDPKKISKKYKIPVHHIESLIKEAGILLENGAYY